jgi:hypothetical protein
MIQFLTYHLSTYARLVGLIYITKIKQKGGMKKDEKGNCNSFSDNSSTLVCSYWLLQSRSHKPIACRDIYLLLCVVSSTASNHSNRSGGNCRNCWELTLWRFNWTRTSLVPVIKSPLTLTREARLQSHPSRAAGGLMPEIPAKWRKRSTTEHPS